MNNFSLGKYVPYDTWVHRLDARVKLLATILLMVAIFLPVNGWWMTLLTQGVLMAFAIFIVLGTKTKLTSILSSLKSMWIMVIFLMIIYIVVPKTTHVLPVAWEVNGWVVYWDSFAEAARIVARLVMMMMLAMSLTASTKPLDLTYALQWYMAPLKPLHFPVEEIAMTISIALRFIPTLLEDAMRVMRAQSSRGVDFQHGNIWKRLTGITALIIPLFVSSFIRSEELANAMECRCYDPRAERTKYRKLKFHFRDAVAFIVAAGFLAAAIYFSVSKMNFFAFTGV